MINQEFLDNQKVKNMIGIGITEEHATPAIKELCSSNKYIIFYWTMRDDQPKIPLKAKSYREAYLQLIEVGINGFIT